MRTVAPSCSSRSYRWHQHAALHALQRRRRDFTQDRDRMSSVAHRRAQGRMLPTSPTFLNLLLMSHAYERYDLSSLRVDYLRHGGHAGKNRWRACANSSLR